MSMGLFPSKKQNKTNNRQIGNSCTMNIGTSVMIHTPFLWTRMSTAVKLIIVALMFLQVVLLCDFQSTDILWINVTDNPGKKITRRDWFPTGFHTVKHGFKQKIFLQTYRDFWNKIGVSRSETGNTARRVSRFKYRKLGGFPGNFQLYCTFQWAFVITHLVNPRVKHRVSRFDLCDK